MDRVNPERWKWCLVGVGLACSVAVALGGASGAGAAPARKCVGVFVTKERTNFAADAKSLTVVGNVPCTANVVAWAGVGIYRAFDDGAVEFLAVPMPPCPEGDAFVWLRFPNQ